MKILVAPLSDPLPAKGNVICPRDCHSRVFYRRRNSEPCRRKTLCKWISIHRAFSHSAFSYSNIPADAGMFGRSIKTVPLFELFAHVIPVKSLFLDPVIDHIASLAVNFQGPLILDMGIETAFRFTPGTEEGLAMVHESSPHAGPLGPSLMRR